ncbi:MAG TPA: type IV pilus secretin PilQ [bacterium]|nr:type IV pilus secretin PilQ [bacterium]
MEKRESKFITYSLPVIIFFLSPFFISVPITHAGMLSGNARFVHAGNGQAQIMHKTVKKLFVDPTNMKVSFDFQNASVTDVIRMIAKISNMNVLIGSNVKGTVTMKMSNVPLKDILSVVMEAYGLGMVKKDGIYYINSSGTIASVVSSEKKARAISEHKIIKIIPVNYVSITGLIPKVKTVLSPEGKVMYDKSLHALLVRDIPSGVARAERLVGMLDKRTPEVEIIAKMVEVNKNYSEQLGINWSGSYLGSAPTSSNAAVTPNYFGGETTGSPSGPGLSPTLTTQASPGTFSIGILNQYASINVTLHALESLSKAKSIASPKIVVLNNQTATIEKGQTLYLPGVAGVGATAAPQAITAQIALKITPHIMSNGNVKLVISSTNNTIAPPISGAQATLDTESANSTVIIKSGQTVVIGGVYQLSKTVSNNGIPGLMDIPLLGWIFKSRDISYSKDELLIFITPRIIKG